MPRARNLKPGFFSNEDLAECSPWARLCFAGLWTLADREGRLEDRPKRIKGELFRFDTVDVEPLLQELARHRFILRYQVDGERFIQVSKFLEHQTPHYSEKPSVIKAPALQEKQEDIRPSNSKSPPRVEPSSRGGRNALNPSSLNPDSPNPEEETSNLAVAPALPSEDRPPLTLVEPPAPKPWEPPDCPHLEVLALWAEVLPAMPQHLPKQWKGARADHLRTRWRETAVDEKWPDQAAGLTYFRRLFAYVGKSAFLTGRVKPRDEKPPFVIELEWLVLPSNWAKVIEGKYHQESA